MGAFLGENYLAHHCASNATGLLEKQRLGVKGSEPVVSDPPGRTSGTRVQADGKSTLATTLRIQDPSAFPSLSQAEFISRKTTSEGAFWVGTPQ